LQLELNSDVSSTSTAPFSFPVSSTSKSEWIWKMLNLNTVYWLCVVHRQYSKRNSKSNRQTSRGNLISSISACSKTAWSQ
jgi:hypothetical protein